MSFFTTAVQISHRLYLLLRPEETDRYRTDTLQNMTWFKTWFNNPLYEKVYAYRDEEEAALLADFIETLIPADRWPKLLDLACGRGRHSLNMARRGYRVTGVDLAPEAIKTASEKALEEGITSVTFEIGDMREPVGGPYDSILNLFTSFGYFEDDEENIRVLRNVESMLIQGGFFIQDYLNPVSVRNTLVPREERTAGRSTFQIERKIEQDMVIKTIRFSGDSDHAPAEFSERVKLYENYWFKEQLKKSGLTLIATYGDYEGSPFDPETSPRQLMVSQKKG